MRGEGHTDVFWYFNCPTKADSVGLSAPLRIQMSEDLSLIGLLFWVRTQWDQMDVNHPTIQRSGFSQAFEVHNLG